MKELTTQVGSAAATKTTFGYDASGEMTLKTPATGAATSYSWDKQGRLSGANTVAGTTTQIYDADGNLLIKRESSGTTLYADGGSEIIWNKTANRLDTRYTYSLAGQLVGTRNISGLDKTDRTSILVADHHGTGELALDSDTLAVTWRRTLPFGEARGSQGSWVSDRGFVGGIMDETTGLTQLGVRPYDPVLGRFITVDPVMSLSDPQQWNAYSYANHNPTRFLIPVVSGRVRVLRRVPRCSRW